MSREAINKRREQHKTEPRRKMRLKQKWRGRKKTGGEKTKRIKEGDSKWSMELHLSQLATAGVLGEKGESVHPY